MRLYEIYYRKLEENGMFGETTYPFESDQENNWDDLQELGEHLFGKDVEVEGDFVSFDGNSYKFNWKD